MLFEEKCRNQDCNGKASRKFSKKQKQGVTPKIFNLGKITLNKQKRSQEACRSPSYSILQPGAWPDHASIITNKILLNNDYLVRKYPSSTSEALMEITDRNLFDSQLSIFKLSQLFLSFLFSYSPIVFFSGFVSQPTSVFFFLQGTLMTLQFHFVSP